MPISDYSSLFSSLPDDARLWVHVAPRRLSADEQQAFQSALDSFFENWSSHGRTVEGAAHVHEDQILFLAAHVSDGDLSGCGIDAGFNAIEQVAGRLDLEWVPSLHVVYRDDEGRLQHASRSTFRDLANRSAVTTETPVLDISITTVGELRNGQFERPAGSSWHARTFDLPQPV